MATRVISISDLDTVLMKLATDVIEDTIIESVEQMKLFAPVDSGDLRDSIGVERADGMVVIGASTPYAPFVEQGTSTNQPNPFVRPTIDSIPAIIKRVTDK